MFDISRTKEYLQTLNFDVLYTLFNPDINWQCVNGSKELEKLSAVLKTLGEKLVADIETDGNRNGFTLLNPDTVLMGAGWSFVYSEVSGVLYVHARSGLASSFSKQVLSAGDKWVSSIPQSVFFVTSAVMRLWFISTALSNGPGTGVSERNSVVPTINLAQIDKNQECADIKLLQAYTQSDVCLWHVIDELGEGLSLGVSTGSQLMELIDAALT